MISENIQKEILFATDVDGQNYSLFFINPLGQELYSKIFTLMASQTEFQQFKEFKSTQTNKYEFYEELCNEIVSKNQKKAVLMTNKGIDAYILCNKVKGIRAALIQNEYAGQMTKEHNDANLIIIPSFYLGWELAKNIILKYCGASFCEQPISHSRRIQLISKIENGEVESK